MNTILIISGRNGRLWPAVLQAAEAARAAGRPVVLYVPEQLTLQAERDLIAGLKLPGLLDMDVISPRKLRMQVRECTGSSEKHLLDDLGNTMAVHRAMTETAEELSYYRGMGDLPGAVRRVKEALSELRESDITQEELDRYAGQASTGAERAKARDLSMIREAYSRLAGDRFEDEKTAWTDMVNRLVRSRMWEGREILVYGFDSIRPDLRELLVKAAPQTAEIRVFLLMDTAQAPDGRIFQEPRRSAEKLEEQMSEAGGETGRQELKGERTGQNDMLRWLEKHLFAETEEPWTGASGEAITLFAAAGPEEETADIAQTLRKWHEEGIAWSRMAVAIPRGEGADSALQARLRLDGIPFFCTEKAEAVSHGVCRMLQGALMCIADGYQTDAVMAVARSGFCTLTEEEGRKLENYALAHGTERNQWQTAFIYGEDAAEMEEIRLRLLAPLEKMREELKKARNAAESVEAIVHFLETEKVWDRLQEREERLLGQQMYREAVVDRQIWKLLTELLDQLWTLLGERRSSIREMKSLIDCALDGASVSVLPEQETGVMIGGIGHMLPGSVDALIVSGAEEGILTAPESGWITDRERSAMESSTGREIGLSREKRGMIRQYDFYRTLTLPERRLRITRRLRDDDGKVLSEDGLVTVIRRLFPALREEGSALDSGTAARAETPLAAMEGMGEFLSAVRDGREIPDREHWEQALVNLLHSQDYGQAAKETLRAFRGKGGKQAVVPETAQQLFTAGQVSVSRLERFASCPYRHFIDYGLRPVHRETFDFADNDAGTFFHAALDRYVRRAALEPGWPDMTREEADRMMDSVIREMTDEWEGGPLREDALGVWQGESYIRRVHHAGWALTRFAANSDFRTIATEQTFGGTDGSLPPLILCLKDGERVAVRGTIDRIDTYENGEGIWLRIVDNKSREKKPEPALVASGEQLQLLIYLKAAAGAFPGSHPAGAMYFPIQDQEINTNETDPEAVSEKRLKDLRMKGLVTAEEDVIRAMDRDLRPFSVDLVFNKDGSVRKSADCAMD